MFSSTLHLEMNPFFAAMRLTVSPMALFLKQMIGERNRQKKDQPFEWFTTTYCIGPDEKRMKKEQTKATFLRTTCVYSN